MRFTVTTVHGEGASLYHVVDTDAPEALQPLIVNTYVGGRQRGQADRDAHRQAWDEVHKRNAQDAERLAKWDRACS